MASQKCGLSIVLFDEIEKAAPSMARLLLGVLDRGVLRLGDPVTRIETLGDRATGVVTKSGLTIPADANIIMAAPADVSELKTGAQVAMTATRQADGSFSASRVTLAKPGAQLPY